MGMCSWRRSGRSICGKRRRAGNGPVLTMQASRIASSPIATPVNKIASNVRMMHNRRMRTTVNLDEDAYELAKLRARAKGITLGAALSESVREAHEARLQEKSLPEGLVRGPKGMLMFAARKD